MQERPHKYEVELDQEQRHALQQLISKAALRSANLHMLDESQLDRLFLTFGE